MNVLRYLVWNDDAKEGVVFGCYDDADVALNGPGGRNSHSTLAGEFFELYQGSRLIEIHVPEDGK